MKQQNYHVRKSHWLMGLLLSLCSSMAAAMDVVATTTSMGMLAREIGGDQVSVTTLGPPDRDIHYLQAKPGMIMALRQADLLILVGADLEVGWLPAALRSSTNGAIQRGEPGYFEAALHTELTGQSVADRAQGDVHPQGNPHFALDPVRMAGIATALADRMAAVQPEHGDSFRANGKKLAEQLNTLGSKLRKLTKDSKGALLMHKSADYLMAHLKVPVLGYMEPVPGVPPTAAHIKKLSDSLEGRDGVVIHAPYHPDRAAISLAKILGWQRFILPIEPPRNSGFAEYRALMMLWAEALSSSILPTQQ